MQPVPVSRDALAAMRRTMELLERLARTPGYAEALRLPDIARFDPGVPSVLMGYDFHLRDGVIALIEVNTNAGGLFWDGRWLPQPPLWDAPLEERLDAMFPRAWRTIAIMDEELRAQPMLPEMEAYAALFRRFGRRALLVEPQELAAEADGTLARDGVRVDGIYNRCTDFYLETEALAHVRRAYLARRVGLSPHPRAYGLLADKRRFADWTAPGFLERFLAAEDARFLRAVIPETRTVAALDPEALWRERKGLVFKPPASHAGKGVVLGRRITRRRFAELPDGALAQRFFAPGELELEGARWRFDVRLYATGGELVAVAARIWRGQVANVREGGGFRPVVIT